MGEDTKAKGLSDSQIAAKVQNRGGLTEQQAWDNMAAEGATPEQIDRIKNAPAKIAKQEQIAQGQRDLAAQQQAGLQTQQSQANQLAQQQAQAYQDFDPTKYAQQMGALNAYNAQRMGANAGKAARIGNFGQEGALAEGQKVKMNLGQAATGALGQQQDVYGRSVAQAGGQALGEGQLGQGQQGLNQRAAEFQQQVGVEKNKADQAQTDRIIKAGTAVAGAAAPLMSDERSKDDIKPISIMEMAKNIKPVEFKYKKNQGDSGRHVGVIAQDLEKSPATKETVKEVDTPSGKRKAIDTGELSTVNTGAISELARHIVKIEDMLKKRGE